MGFFNRKKPDNTQDNNQDRRKRWEETFFATLDKKREEDPLIGVKIGAKEIYSQIVENLKESDNRLNVDNLLLVCSGIAGMSCQMTVRKLAEIKQLPIKQALILLGYENGKKYFMGDNLNHFLLENQFSVYNLVLGIYHHIAPEKPLPDMKQYVCACVENLGKEDYKLWGKIPEQDIKKINFSFWKKSHAVAERYCKTPEEMPILYGLILQNAMTDAMKVLDTEKVLDMALENILFSAKLDYSLF
ncbi:MAG: hypothetical protein K2J88_07200 [Oscillospiraceae bacterium]|nr:hypothetical protein [Oscillospiraceae bacterium]